MGISSFWHWLVVLIVVMLIFGTKKLTSIGSDVGKAVKGFKDGMNGQDDKPADNAESPAGTRKDAVNMDAKA